MREYTLFQFRHYANSHVRDWSPVHFVGHLFHNLHARHIAQDLATRDNHLLSDIGLYRSEVEHAAHVGISHDALEELECARSHSHEDPPTVSPDFEGLNHTSLRSKV